MTGGRQREKKEKNTYVDQKNSLGLFLKVNAKIDLTGFFFFLKEQRASEYTLGWTLSTSNAALVDEVTKLISEVNEISLITKILVIFIAICN